MTNFSIRRPKFTIVAMLFFLIFGFVSLTNLPLQLFPNINPPIAAVVTNYNGASPEEVLDRVTVPLESRLSTTSGLKRMTSQTSEGTSLILLEFDWAASIDDVELDIINTIRQIPLPDGANEPSFLKFDPSMMPTLQLAITSHEPVADFQDVVFDLQSEVTKIPGVASVNESGSIIEEVQVYLDQDELVNSGVTQADVVSLIQSHNVAMPGGTVITDELNLTTRVISELTSVEDIEQLVVTVNQETGEEIQLADIASVEIGAEDRQVITRADQEEAIQFTVMKESEANTVAVSNAVNDRLSEMLNESKYEDLEVVSLYDEGEFINLSINSVTNALIFGGILAMLILFFFLRNMKTPLIIGIAIPFSVITTFAFMYFTDIGLNLMSLGGLALGIGMLIDNAIVVIENIYRHLSMQKDPKQAALDGTKEVASAITASTLTTISVFLPIVFISGLIGNLFAEFALTVSFSLIASLIVAVTVIPMIASRWLKTPTENLEEKRIQSKSMQMLKSAAEWVLNHRITVLMITAISLVVGGLGLTTVGVEFLPDSDQGSFTIDIEMENGTSLARTQEAVEAVEEILNDHNEVANYVSTTGATAESMGGGSSHQAQIQVSMVALDQRSVSTSEFIESIERDLARADSDADISASTLTALGADANTITFTISDANPDRLYDHAEELQLELEDLNIVRTVEMSIEELVPEIAIEVDPEAARANGLAPAQIANEVNRLTTGQTASSIQTEEHDIYDIVVSLHPDFIEDIDALENIQIRNSANEFIALSDVAEIVEGESTATINRLEQEEAVEFTVYYTTDTTLNKITNEINTIVDDLDFGDTTSLFYGGERELLDDSIGSMILALVLGIIFIYLVMAAQFESFKAPFIIMFTVPLVVIGVAFILTITQTPIGITVFIGGMVLIGIVVNNAIVLVDYVNQLKARGMASYDALVQGVQDRTRPIVLTSLTAILGMVPLALGIGEGAEMQQPMALVVIGGLISSTFLSLFVIPVVYSLLDSEMRKKKKRYVTVEGEYVEVEELKELPRETRQHSIVLPTETKETTTTASEEEVKKDKKDDEKEKEDNSKSDNESEKKTDISKEEILELLERIVDSSKKKD
ncbi:cation transporter [Alkalihalobacillus alcalophilus ATCC 27647 = CGMCC 1.3604]|uniref:Cation transporter n=1 Tax=Alkalihalobacillus alcalophilus ATCC 27647 = CGMCC 1.3604 TaxID=1218173 RepID=J8T6P7_ALKAL|nr:efflux RND transporter permease subunit [Alkalihalobacillus alcalophilus]AFV25937.1 multidrug/solvent efflux transporter [Alkalihalobacillus alcalophilus ATCC 27647 = CGMCC 1.3604]KGA97272.1 cation transporter [Alkalihalobacillus alcalophilus ATCC 27647 = CGMCC 1.3604]MED1562795.1 efflux RND transporter permease subunit [Alkalihalobacillus alcalophilus]THG91520.1 cation transporter [Alkalihalobacillus alcalophilus ATCC 27647 = CGMCC 1.3604]